MAEGTPEKFPLIEASDAAAPKKVLHQYGTQQPESTFESEEDDDIGTPGAPLDDRIEYVLLLSTINS